MAWQKSHEIRLEKQVPRCSVSVRKRRQKRVSGYFSSVKTGRIVVHGDLQVSDITNAKQTVHCFCLEFEKLLSFCEWRIPAWGLSELFQAHPSSYQFKASWDILSNALSGRPQPSPDPAVVILKYNNCRTGRRLRSSTQIIWQNVLGSLKLITWRVSVVAVESGLQIYSVYLDAPVGFFNGYFGDFIGYIDSLKIYGSKNSFSSPFSKS